MQKPLGSAAETMNWSKSDILLMKRVLRLARRGAGYTSPNPMVGAIVVKNGITIAKGYHRKFGGLHAEVEAIRSGGDKVKGATMYVNLEPCNHFGKTPPCVEEIAKAKLARVIVSMIDPNPLVAGKGIEMLRQKGVEVDVGLLSSDAKSLNEAYVKYTLTGTPFVIMKAAITLDGMIADVSGNSKWISCESSRKLVHQLRREVDSILVGTGTALKDDPELTVRLVKSSRNPKRILLDTHLRVPPQAKILNEAAHTIVITTAGEKKVEPLKRIGKEIWFVEKSMDGRISLSHLLRRAAAEGITSVLVEGGRRIYSSFLSDGLVDKLYLFITPKFLGAGIPLVEGLGVRTIENPLRLKNVSFSRVNSEILVVAYF